MIRTTDTVLQEECWLLPYAPDWRQGIETRFTIPADAERGLTGREDRRSYAKSLRAEVTYAALLGASEAVTLRNALQAADVENLPVWFPFWPGEWPIEPGYGNRFAAAQAILWQGNSNAALVNPGSVSGSYAPHVRLVPALRGYFVEPPTVEALTDELFIARFRLREDGPASLALQVSGAAFAAGPDVGGRSFSAFPFRPQWRGKIESGTAKVEIDSREIGFNREEARAVYPQSPERPLRYDLAMLDNAAGADLIRFFGNCEGNVATFWCPTWLSDTRLTANVTAGATTLPVANGQALGLNNYLALVDRNGTTEVRTVTNKAAGSLTVFPALSSVHAAESAIVTTAALVRFAKTGLTLRWYSTGEVEASVELKEVATDYYTPGGELHGSTVGKLPRACFLYRFTVAYPGTSQVWRLTSYEQAISYESAAYTPRPIEHGDIRETLNLERNEVEVRTRAFEGNPLMLFIPFRLEFPLKLEIIEAKTNAAGDTITGATRVFSGEVVRVNFDGPYLTARAVTIGNLFERKIPRLLMQPTCNYALFDGACGLAKADWQYRGYLIEHLVNPTRLRLRTLSRVNGTWILPDAHWFAGGWVELGSGEDFESRFIADAGAYNPSGSGFIEITLSTPLRNAPEADDEVILYPGCDGKHGTCLGKFGNFARFGGFPHMPVGNPSMVKMPANRNMK
jgi:uncharacterized phage protein (TIGR02218 family)